MKKSKIKSLLMVSLLGLISITLITNTVVAFVDSYEDNDTYGTATTVTKGTYSNLYRELSDDDWYKINLNTGDTITAKITYSAGDGLGMEMTKDNAAIFMGASYSDTGVDSITFVMNYTGYIYVVVGGSTYSTKEGAYTLIMTVTEVGGTPPADEPAIGGFETALFMISTTVITLGIIIRLKKRLK